MRVDMTKIFLGTIRGNTIQLDDPSGLLDGQRVEVVLNACNSKEEWQRKARTLVGSLSELGNDVDEDLSAILSERNEASREIR